MERWLSSPSLIEANLIEVETIQHSRQQKTVPRCNPARTELSITIITPGLTRMESSAGLVGFFDA